MTDIFEQHTGTLSDDEIQALCAKGQLIAANFVGSNLKQACYELRASSTYYDLAEGKERYSLEPGEYILLKPKNLVVVITLESLDLPPDILGRVLTKGKLFSIGILPVNTYADPGFKGNLGIVMYNASNNYLRINPGDAIAKIEFSQLAKEVRRPYHGQHGYETKIWPIPEDMILSIDEVAQDARVGSVPDEIVLAYGDNVGRVIDRVFRFERYLILAICSYIFLTFVLILLLNGTSGISPVVAIVLGVVSNLITAFLIYLATNLRRK